jgi:hypothetical protein
MPVIRYECHISGEPHEVPGDEVRIMKHADGGFVVACGCGPESVAEADAPPHPVDDHLANIYANDPTPGQWRTLEDAADGWYDATAFAMHPDYPGTYGAFRQMLRERAADLADDGDHGEPTDREVAARNAVGCPHCGAGTGSKCQRPGGHTVRTVHPDRIEAAVEAGDLDAQGESEGEQAALTGWSA